MKISTRVRYGLKALVYIADKSSENKLIRIKEISDEQGVSVQYLEQILFRLKNENIIEGLSKQQKGVLPHLQIKTQK